jgi:hypothetical protein
MIFLSQAKTFCMLDRDGAFDRLDRRQGRARARLAWAGQPGANRGGGATDRKRCRRHADIPAGLGVGIPALVQGEEKPTRRMSRDDQAGPQLGARLTLPPMPTGVAYLRNEVPNLR